MKNIKISKTIHPGLGYDYKLGVFWRLKEVQRVNPDNPEVVTVEYVPSHLLFENNDGVLQYLCAVTKKNLKHKPIRAAYEIFNEIRLTPQDVIYPKDLDDHNWKADNLGRVTRAEYAKIKDALYNLQGGLQVEPHPDHAYTYVVSWKEKGRIRKKTVHDVTKVQQLKRIIRIKSSKILSKYIVST